MVMPYKLSCAPSGFQCLINDAVGDMLEKYVIAFTDNILVYSPSLEIQVTKVKNVLSHWQENQLFIKADKCKLYHPTIMILRYFISQEGIKMDDTKVKAVTEWPVPCTVKDPQIFLGFANFYQHHSSPTFHSLKGRPKETVFEPHF